MSFESDSKVEDDEEKKTYQLIYDMYTTAGRENENAEGPSSPWGNLKAAQDDEDSGSDSTGEYNSFCVTMSSEHYPVHVKINAPRCLHAVVSTAKGSDMDAVDTIQEMPVQKVYAKSIEEKPWRKAGADISDYFNYGFDEKSWNTYCKKQTKLCAANLKLRFQKEHNRRGEGELSCAYSSSGRSSIIASRESSPLTDVTGSQPGSSRRMERHRCLSDEENNSEVVTEMTSEEGRITSYHPTPLSNFSSVFPDISPPRLHDQRKHPPFSPLTTVDRGHAKDCDDLSTSQYTFSSGTVACSAGVTNTAKAWEYYILQEKCDRDRSREHCHEKNSREGRERGSSSLLSGEERMRHRDTVEQLHRRHRFEGDNGQNAEQHRWQKSSHSSSSSGNSNVSRSRSRSRRNYAEDRKSQSKNTKRNVKDKETRTRSSLLTKSKIKFD